MKENQQTQISDHDGCQRERKRSELQREEENIEQQGPNQQLDGHVSHDDHQHETQQVDLEQQERIEQQERQKRREQERLREMERLERERQREYRLRNVLQRDFEHRINSSGCWNGWGIGVHMNRGSTSGRFSRHPNMPIRR